MYPSSRGVRGPDKEKRHCRPRVPKSSRSGPLTSDDRALVPRRVRDHLDERGSNGSDVPSTHPTSKASPRYKTVSEPKEPAKNPQAAKTQKRFDSKTATTTSSGINLFPGRVSRRAGIWSWNDTSVQCGPSLDYYRKSWWDHVVALYSFDSSKSP